MATVTQTPAAVSPLSGRQVQIQLTTKQAHIALPNDNGPILVDTNLRRYALSVLVNHLLGHTEKSQRIPFDFLINGTILRTSLEEFLTTNGVSSETVLNAEYIPAFVPPKHQASFEHDAWVSSIDVVSSVDSKCGIPLLLSGSYDGLCRIWNQSKQILATSPYLGDSRYVAATKVSRFVSPTMIASAGMDRTIRLWRFRQPDSAADADSSKITLEADLHWHKQMILDLDVEATSHKIISASADHTLAVWHNDPVEAPTYTALNPSAKNKKQKKSSIPQLAPLSTLTGHTHHVTGTIFSPHAAACEQAYSISSDSTLKTWSLSTSSVIDNRQLSDPLYSLTALTSMHLLAVGSSKGDITLLDPRTSSASVKVSTIRQAHSQGFVNSLAADPSNQYRFASGGFDGAVKIWDIRSLTSASAVIDRKDDGGKGGKVLAVKWDAEMGILSAGEDSRVRIDK